MIAALLSTWFLTLPQRAIVSVGDRLTPANLLDVRGGVAGWAPGKVTVFSFCAYWCDTWKSQVPKLVEAKRATEGLPVSFHTVSIDGRWTEVAKNNGGLPLWRDPGAEWSRSIGIDRVPTTLVVDRTGKIAFVSTGVVRRDELLKAIRATVSERGASGGTVYLTFDDYPPDDGGEELLDALRALELRATLFVIGSKVERSQKVLRRALSEGHSLQCHSWSHDAANPKLESCHEIFTRLLGRDFDYYRAPGSETILGMETPLPVVDPYDFQRPGQEELIRRILAGVRPGAEIQLHAGVRDTLEALPALVRRLRTREFEFAVLPPKSNSVRSVRK